MEHALCAPCGLAALINADSYRSQIYMDSVHPTALTQYTNACVFYAVLTNRSPVGLGGSVDGAMPSTSVWPGPPSSLAATTASTNTAPHSAVSRGWQSMPPC